MNGAASATPAAAVAPSPVPQRKGVLPASRPRGESLLMNSPRPTTAANATAATATNASVPVAAAPSKVVEPVQASPPPRGPKMLPVKQLPPASAVPSKAVPLGGSGATQPPTTLGAIPKTAPPPGASSPPKTLPPKMLGGLPNAGPSKAASPAPVKTLPPRKLLPTKTSPAPPPAAAVAYPQQHEATRADDAPYSNSNHFLRDDDDFLQDFTDPVTPLNHPQPPPSSHYSAHQFGNIAWQQSTAQRYREELEDRYHYETVIRSQRERIEALEIALDRSERDREEVYARLDATIDVLAIANEERIALLYGGHLHDAPAGANTSGGGINRSPRQASGVLASQRGLTVATPAGPRQVQPPAVLPPKARPTTPPPATAVVTKFVPPSSAARADPSPIRVVSLSEPLELDKTPRERRCVVGVFQITGVNFALYEFARKSGYPAVAEFERFLRDDVVTMVNEAVPHAAETLLTSIAVGAGQVRTIHVAYPATASFNPELRPLISDADWPIRVDVTVRGFATEQDVATVAARMEAYSKLSSALRGAMVFGKLSFPQVLSNGVKEPRVDNTCCSVSIIGQVLEPPAPAAVPPPSNGNNNSTAPHQTRPATPASSSVTVDASSMTHNDEVTSAPEVRAVKTRAEHMTVSPKPASTVPLAETEAEAKAKRQPVSTLVKVAVCFKTLLFSRYSHDVALRRDIMDAFVNDLRDGGADEQDWLAVDASFGALNAGVGSMLAVTLCATAALGSYSERGQAAEALAQMIRGYIAKQSFSRVNGVNQMSGPRSNNRLEVAPLVIDLSRSTVNGVALADKDVLPARPDATHASSPPPRHAASAPGSATRGPVELRNAVEFIDIDNASPWGNQRTPSATAHSNTNNEAGYYSSTSQQQQRSRQVSATHRTTAVRQEDDEAPTTYTTYTTPNTQHSQPQSRQNSDQVQRTLLTGRQQPQQTQRRPVSQAPDVTVRVTYVLPAFNYERFVESNSRVIEEAIEQDAMALAEPFVAGRDAVRVYFADGASSSRADYADALAVVVDNDMVRGDVAAFTAAIDDHFGQLQTLGSLRRFASVGAREPLVPRGGWTYSSYYVDDAVDSSASPPRDREEGAVVTVVVSLDEADWYSYEDASRRDPNLDDALSRASSRDLFDALGSGALVPEDHIRTSVVMRQGLTAIKGTITLPAGVSRDTAVKRLEAYFGQESAMLKAKLVLVRHLDVDMRYGVPADAVNIFDGDS